MCRPPRALAQETRCGLGTVPHKPPMCFHARHAVYECSAASQVDPSAPLSTARTRTRRRSASRVHTGLTLPCRWGAREYSRDSLSIRCRFSQIPAHSARWSLPQKPSSFGARRLIRVSATTAKICSATCSTRRYQHASAHAACPPTNRASVRALSPSIFRAAEFGGYVVTRFLADSDFHAYRPTVHIRLRLSQLRPA